MSEVSVDQQPTGGTFDDRIDTDPHISNREAIRLIGRALGYVVTVKNLFAAKFGLALIALLPGFLTPWLGKILIDQVILQKPFNDAEVPFPPYFQPFVDWLRDMAPMEIMFTLTAIFLGMLFVFGRPNRGLGVKLEPGYDSATQSEGKLSAGGSETGGLLGGIETLVNIRLTQRLANGFRTRLFARLTRLPMQTIDDHRIGDSVYRVMYDAPDLPDVCYSVTLEPLFVLLGVAIALYLMGVSYGGVAPELIWISVATMPVAIIITVPFSALVRRVQQSSRASGAATTNAIEESMSNLRAVQSLGGMRYEKERVEKRSSESFRRFRHVVLAYIGIGSIRTMISGMLTIAVMVIVTNRIIEGSMSPGDYFVLIDLTTTVGGAGLAMGLFWINLQGPVAAIRRVFFFVDMSTEDPQAGLTLPEVTTGVRFEAVGLSYPNGHRALQNIDLELSVGKLVAIVGPTGAGKTSLAYLIPGFYTPTEGRVLIDGQDVSATNIGSLRDQISYIFQEHHLLNESIRSNLELANPKASESDLLDACRTAGAMEFIEELPEGLDTVLGQSGDTLSVGQKQRLCIARGLVRNTKILILDEPTAALDPQTENALVRTLQEAARDRLVIVIAHRLSTIRQAEQIIFLEDGEIKDIGDHESLMALTDSAYRKYVELQGG